MSIYNFSAGPAVIPTQVRARIKDEFDCYGQTQTSVMEISHRGADFIALAKQAKTDIIQLMDIPLDYEVLFLQGGASLQFSMLPLNLLNGKNQASYALTGQWSQKAITEAKRYAKVNICTDSTANKFTDVADTSTWDIANDNAFVHCCPNETIAGLEFDGVPNTSVPIVADMSSNILSKKIKVSNYDVIYATAQKNMGIAGLTIVIIKKSLIGLAGNNTPALLNYKNYADNDSMFNTPSTFSWYVSGLIFDWIKQNGGVEAIEQRNKQKAILLYSAIDNLGLYSNPVNPKYRSKMNVPFLLSDDKLNAVFLEKSHQAGLLALKGHKAVGGMRASIYNAMPLEGVQALVDFMVDFEKQYG